MENTVNTVLLKANESDLAVIWEILQDAIAQRKADGSNQWQNGYPNEQTAKNDIAAGNGYLLKENGEVIAYAAIIFGDEPAYDGIVGQWLSNGQYAVVHRVARSARSSKAQSKGIANKMLRLIEALCINNGVPSIRLDTNFDNAAMLNTLAKLDYIYCGEIFYQGAPRRAYEKILLG